MKKIAKAKKEEKPMSNQIAISKPAGAKTLPDNGIWINRFEIKSSSSNRVYIIAQKSTTGKFACSCPAYCTRRYCKHLLEGCGLTRSQIEGHGSITSGPGASGKLKG